MVRREPVVAVEEIITVELAVVAVVAVAPLTLLALAVVVVAVAVALAPKRKKKVLRFMIKLHNPAWEGMVAEV